ncbi:MAG: MarR family transcriptional regulator [Alphaproteobacteria bacterium]|nr:MarR family transcriptional regulator [Alphaproteobacteria bacterium]
MVDTDNALIPVADLLCFSVYSTSHAFNRIYKPMLDELGLTYPQYLVLVALWEQDDRTVGDLGRTLQLESNTLTPLLKRLETAGHVVRRRDLNDERQVRVSLTESGRTMKSRATEIPVCILDSIGVDLEELQDLQHRITALRDRLNQTDA